MKLTRNSILAAGSLIIGGFIGASALVAMAGWQSAPNNPPTCDGSTYPGCNQPINVGNGTALLGSKISGIGQEKTNSLAIDGYLFTPNLVVATGTPIAGQSVLVAQDSAGTVGWGSATGGGGVNHSYSVVWGTPTWLTTSGWANTGLAITLTPTSASSKIYINASIVANNDNQSGTCAVALYRDSTMLVKFTDRGGSDNENVLAWPVTYIDTPGNTQSHTYMVKADPTSVCALNMNANNNLYATSTMTILDLSQ